MAEKFDIGEGAEEAAKDSIRDRLADAAKTAGGTIKGLIDDAGEPRIPAFFSPDDPTEPGYRTKLKDLTEDELGTAIGIGAEDQTDALGLLQRHDPGPNIQL